VSIETHLQMIQAVITRLASQSTTIKGWCVTVTAALLGVGAGSTTPLVAIIAAYVVSTFAVLDAYYLSLERGYRDLYRRTVAGQVDEWSLEIDRPGWDEVGRALKAPAVALLYGASLLTAAAVAAYLLATN
jgi:hypothetical protein